MSGAEKGRWVTGVEGGWAAGGGVGVRALDEVGEALGLAGPPELAVLGVESEAGDVAFHGLLAPVAAEDVVIIGVLRVRAAEEVEAVEVAGGGRGAVVLAREAEDGVPVLVRHARAPVGADGLGLEARGTRVRTAGPGRGGEGTLKCWPRKGGGATSRTAEITWPAYPPPRGYKRLHSHFKSNKSSILAPQPLRFSSSEGPQ